MALNDRAYRVSSIKRQISLGNLEYIKFEFDKNILRNTSCSNAETEEVSLKNSDPIRQLNIGIQKRR